MFSGRLAAAAVSLTLTGAAAAADLKSEKAPVAPAEVPSSFFLFPNTQMSYRYQFPAANPGSQVQRADGSFRNQDASKHILNISHADAWEYGRTSAPSTS